MKKTLLFLLVALMSMSASANRKWDFTNWSSATVTNLMAGCYANENNFNPASNWSDVESEAKMADTYGDSQNNCFWEVKAQGDAAKGATVQANGTDIAELNGLLYTLRNDRTLAIALNYPKTSLGEYHGPSYLWLGNKTKNYFVIPNVKPGAIITIGEESHKPAEGRGVKLYIVAKGEYGTLGTELKDPDGNAVGVPTTYEEKKWLVPEEGLTDTPNEDGTYDVMIYNTNGCHLYFIDVNEPGSVAENKNVAWISASENAAEEDLYRMYAPSDGVTYTDINSNDASLTSEDLRQYDAVVISTNVATSDVTYNLLKDNIAFVPMINLNSSLFGYEAQETGNTTLTAQSANSALFEGVSLEEGTGAFEYADVAVTVPADFANDLVIAKNGDFTAFHQHAANRNSYLFLPAPADGNIDTELWASIFNNALNIAASTKRDVVAATAPVASSTYENNKTTVKISSTTSGAVVYYSLDGTSYEKYSSELTFTEPTTVYAYAEAEGYLNSEVSTSEIIIKEQTAKPAIAVANNGDKTTLTITAEEGASVYYSFVKTEDTSKMSFYSEPVVVSAPGTIYAVATISDKLNSQLASKEYTIETLNANTIRLDTLAHFDANQADCYDAVSAACIESFAASGTASAFYYFGKSAWNYYKTDENGSRIKADSTLISSDPETYEYIYIPNPEALKTVNFGNGWMLKSYGTVATFENIAAELAVGNGATGRYADSAEDLIGLAPTKGLIDFAGKKDGDPYSMSIESTAKLAGPFDVVTILGNGSTSNMKLEAQVSTDGENWQTIGELNYSTTQRYWRRSKLAYEGTDEVYLRIYGGGSKGQLYDIYVMYNGENSKKYGSSVAGDVNGDGNVTMSDANDIVSYYLASDKSAVANFNLSAANLIEDYDQETGEPIISMADANEVVSIFLGSGK